MDEAERGAQRSTGEPWPLVGREALLASVVDAVRGGTRRRSAGNPGRRASSGVVLVGEAGAGKTRLMTEVLAAFEADARQGSGPATRRLVATASSRSIPLGALAPVLPLAFDRQDLHGNDLRVAADAVASIEGHDGSDGPGSPGGPGDQRRPSTNPIIAVDDAHHLDEASATVLLQLAVEGRIAIVATVRTGEPLSDSVTALWKDDLVQRIDVDRLTEAAVGLLTERVLGGPITSATKRALWTTSSGNPLFLRELVTGAVDSGVLRPTDGVWQLADQVQTTPKLAELISARLGDLSPGRRHLLGLLAIAGPLGSEELRRAAADPDHAAEDLIALEARGVVEVNAERRRWTVRLAHPLYGEVIEAQLPKLALRDLRLRLADAVEATGARRREDPMRIALWRIDGGGDVDVALATNAARRAMFSFDLELAERLARVAIDAGGGADAALILSELLHKRGANAEADALYATLSVDGAADDDPHTRAVATLHRATNLFYGFGEVDQAFALLEQITALPGLGEVRDEAAAVHATLEMSVGHFTRGRELAAPLLDHASGRVLVNASIAEAGALAAAGRTAEAIAVAQRALTVHREMGDQQMLARPWIHELAMVLAATEGGQLDDADAMVLGGHDAAVDRREPAAQGWFALAAGRVALVRGNPTVARRFCAEAALVLDELGEIGPWRWAVAGIAICAAFTGDAASTTEAVRRLAASPSPMRMMATDVLRAEAWDRFLRGEVDEARHDLRAGIEVVAAEGASSLAGAAAWDLARLGDAKGAAAALRELRDLSDVLALRADHADALVARDAEALATAAGRLEAFGFELEAAEARSSASTAFTRGGRRREAAAMATAVEAFLARGGGVRTRLLLAATEQAPLTERMRDIALLAAEGRTSKDIAQHLGLSPRTVDNNLQQIYTRLGITRRADLAAALGL